MLLTGKKETAYKKTKKKIEPCHEFTVLLAENTHSITEP